MAITAGAPMPTGTTESDGACLRELAGELGSTWSRVRVRARALSEPDLVDFCRSALADLLAGSAAAGSR